MAVPKDLAVPLEQLLEHIQQSVVTTDLQGIVTSWNEGAERLYGYAREEAIGHSVSMLLPGGRAEMARLLDNRRALLDERGVVETEGWCVRSTGERLQVHARIMPLLAPGGEHVGYIAYTVETGRERQALEAIRDTQQRLLEQNELYSALLKAQSDVGQGVIIIENEKLVYANEAVGRLLGYSVEELGERRSFAELCHPSCRQAVVSNHRRRLAGEQLDERYEITVLRKDGTTREAEIAVAVIRSEKHVRIVVVVVDITEKKQAQDRLAYLSSVVEQTSDSVMLTDIQGTIEYVNAAMERNTGYTREELLGRKPSVFKSGIHPRSFYEQLWRTVLSGKVFRNVFVNRRKDGRTYYVEKTITPIRDGGGRIMHFSSIDKDVTERFHAEERIKYLALHDTLTGLANRALLIDRLRRSIAVSRRKKLRFGVFFLDLDGFKPINDEFGHKAGDQVLREIGQRMLSLVRESDTVARIGGDEFVLLVHDLQDEGAVGKVAVKLLAVLDPAFTIQHVSRHLGASIGVALYPDHGRDVDALLQAADTAMYEAKHQGKNRYCLAR